MSKWIIVTLIAGGIYIALCIAQRVLVKRDEKRRAEKAADLSANPPEQIEGDDIAEN